MYANMNMHIHIHIHIYIHANIIYIYIYTRTQMMFHEVSLLRSFADISASPLGWTPGLHGLSALFWMQETVKW